MSVTWLMMLAINLIIPMIMIGFGKAFMKSPPKDINDAFGYRTAMSKKNPDTWEFAHKHFGRIWFRVGLVLLPVSVALMLTALGKTEEEVLGLGALACCVETIPMVLCMIPTELALRRTFDKTGARKQK